MLNKGHIINLMITKKNPIAVARRYNSMVVSLLTVNPSKLKNTPGIAGALTSVVETATLSGKSIHEGTPAAALSALRSLATAPLTEINYAARGLDELQIA